MTCPLPRGLPAQRAIKIFKCVVERWGEREAEWFEHYEEQWNWGLQGSEEQPDVSGLPVLPPETLVKFWSILPWRVMSGSMAM